MRALDGYLLLEGEGGVWSFDGQQLSPGKSGWRPWLRGMPMPARARGRFTVMLPPGATSGATWHAIVTEPGTYRVLASARAAFEGPRGR
jgi:hypothetical protein